MAIDICPNRHLAVTGQVGSRPTLFVWDATTGEKKQKFELKKGARGVSAVAFSRDASLIACVDLHNDHNVHVFDVATGALRMSNKGGPDRVYDIKFSQQEGST